MQGRDHRIDVRVERGADWSVTLHEWELDKYVTLLELNAGDVVWHADAVHVVNAIAGDATRLVAVLDEGDFSSPQIVGGPTTTVHKLKPRALDDVEARFTDGARIGTIVATHANPGEVKLELDESSTATLPIGTYALSVRGHTAAGWELLRTGTVTVVDTAVDGTPIEPLPAAPGDFAGRLAKLEAEMQAVSKLFYAAIASGGEPGRWSSASGYYDGDVVWHSDALWVADGGPQIGEEPGTGTVWRPLSLAALADREDALKSSAETLLFRTDDNDRRINDLTARVTTLEGKAP